MKVLYLGSCNSPILNPLLRTIKSGLPDIEADVVDLVGGGSTEHAGEDPLFGEQKRSPQSALLRKLWPARRKSGLLHPAPASPSGGGARRRPRRRLVSLPNLYLRGIALEAWLVRRKWRQLLKGYDLCHVHSLLPGSHVAALRYLPPDTPTLVSIWGSDLFRLDNVRAIDAQRALLERVDIVSVSSIEMREHLLTKFGRKLKPKVRYAHFQPGAEAFDLIDQIDAPGARSEFLTANGIDPAKTVIAIGHSGRPLNHHLPATRALAELDPGLKAEVHLLYPMTYVAPEAHVREVKQAAAEAGFEATVLTEFLSDDDVAKLRLASDIFVFAPESDAYSAAVTQVLFAGNLVVSGAWLPYGERRRAGFVFDEIEDFPDLPRVVGDLLRDLPSARARVAGNRELVRSFFDESRIAGEWACIYRELHESAGGLTNE